MKKQTTTSKNQGVPARSPEAAYFHNLRDCDALILTISAGLRARSFEQKLNGGDNVTGYGDAGDIGSFADVLRDLNDRVNNLGEYA